MQVHGRKFTIKSVGHDVQKFYAKHAPYQFLAYWYADTPVKTRTLSNVVIAKLSVMLGYSLITGQKCGISMEKGLGSLVKCLILIISL